MGLITGRITFAASNPIYAADQNKNDGDVWNCVNGNISNTNISTSAAITYSKLSLTGGILNADINASAGIVATKLATIATAGKVSGAALTSLSSTPSGAGVIPTVNLGSGTANSGTFLRGDQSYAVPPSPSNTILSIQLVEGTSFRNAAQGGVYATAFISKFKKTSGISTVTWYANAYQENSNTVRVKVDVGGANSTASSTATATDTWVNNTIDVSSLTNGTVYDIVISITKDEANGQFEDIKGVVLFGS